MGKGHRTCEACGIKERHTGNKLLFSMFPRDPDRCRKWLKAVGNEELVYLPIEKLHLQRNVCANHFEKKDWNKKGNRLNRNAIPSVNLSALPLTDSQLSDFPQYMFRRKSDAHENSEVGDSQDVNLVSENQNTVSPEIDNCETLKALPQIVDSCDVNEGNSQNNEYSSLEVEDCELSPQILEEIIYEYDTTNDNLSTVIDEYDVTQQTLPQDTPGCVINNKSENIENTTKEGPNKINNESENKEITTKEAPNKINNESENKEITTKEAPNKKNNESVNKEITTKEALNKINNESENKEITTKEAPNKKNNESVNKEITTKKAPNKINNESENKEITTKEASNKIYKVVSINDNLMLVEQNEIDLQLDSANYEIKTKEAPNKIYKVVSINDKLMLVEQNENDLQLDSANDNVDSPLKDGFLADGNPDEGTKQPTSEYNVSAIDQYLSKRYPTQEVVDEEAPITDTSHVEGSNSHAIPAKFNRVIKDFMVNFPDIVNYEMYEHDDIIIYGRNRTALVLLHENKYKDIKTKLKEFIKMKKENDVYKKETQRLRVLCNKLKLHVEELQHIKKCLLDSYSEAQIQILTKRKKHKISWTNEDIKNAIYLYQIINQAAYRYLKCHMKFPLPSLETVKMWMTERNLNFKTRKYTKVKGTTVSNESNIQNIEANELNIPNQEHEITTHESTAEIQYYAQEYNIQNQDCDDSVHQIPIQPGTTASSNPNSQTNEVTETELAVEMIESANDNDNVSEEYDITHENCISNNDNNILYVDQICTQDLTNVHNNEVYAHNSISDNYVITHENSVSINDNNTDNVDGICAQNLTNVQNNEVYEDNAHYSISEDYVITHDNCVSNNDNNTDNVDGICAQNFTNVQNNEVYEDNVHYSISEDYVQDSEMNGDGNNIQSVDVNDAPSSNNAHDITNEGNACGITSEYSKWDLNVIQGFTKLKPNIKRNSWTCQLCMKPFDTEGELKQHVPAHYYNTLCTTYLDAKTPFVCEFCNEQVPKRHSLVQHHVAHLGIEQFKCWRAGCTYVGRNKSCFWKHMAVHLPRRHSCPQCSAAFKQRNELREHFARRHSARVKHRCALCGALCRSDYTYYLHKMSHDKPPRFNCPAAGCSESFYSKRALFVHKRSHEELAAVYQYPHCPLATFTQEFHLNRHLERHEKYQIAQCSKCQKIFDTYSEYYDHIKTDPHTHGKYTCDCTESFKTKPKFNEHQKICTLAVKNDEITSKIVTKQNKNEVKKKDSVPEKLPVLGDSIKQSSIKMQDTTVNQKGNDQIPEAATEQNVATMTGKSHSQEPKDVAVLQSQESSTATNGNKIKHIIQGQKVDASSEKNSVPSNLASNPQTITVKNISQLQNVIQILNKKKGKIFLPQQIFASPEETIQRQSVAIKRTHDHQKDTIQGIKKYIQERKKVVVLEETYQEKILTMNQKDIVVPETRLDQVIPASNGNNSQNIIMEQSSFANRKTSGQVKAITIRRDKGIGATIKLGQVTHDNKSQNVILAQKVAQVSETGSQPKIITLTRAKQELAVATSASKRVIIISKGKRK